MHALSDGYAESLKDDEFKAERKKPTDPRKDQFIIADALRQMAFERTAQARRERERALNGRTEQREMTLDYAWAIQQQANGLFDAANFANNLDLEHVRLGSGNE